MVIKIRYPENFEDCVRNLRYSEGRGNCSDCKFKPKRGVDWKGCAMRVRMFLHEGGNIL